MTDDALTRFQKLLRELFLAEAADLDFGIYRILNARRKEISKFNLWRLLQQEIQPRVQPAPPTPPLLLNAFLLVPGLYDDSRSLHQTGMNGQEAWEAQHVLFQKDDKHLSKMFAALL